ncbi:MAG: ABC transporter substrate-binding protein [Balneola sp.]
MRFKAISIVCLLFLIVSCGKSTEVTIVDDSSGILPGEKTNNELSSEKTVVQDDFTAIKIGELNAIRTLDPLFGTTSSEFRVFSLIYDGLTRIDSEGVIQPAIAKKWTISRDSLRYTFTLRDNVFYHSDSKFTSGIGRQVVPEDIVKNFERMASILVPDNAAQLFTSIKGFNSFHTEQTYIKIPANRTINSIEGISASNDSTLVMQLAKKDSRFLQKLAHPLASVYPGESLPSNKTPIVQPIGTGIYYLAQKKNNLLILASNDDYFQEQTVPTRIDITHGKKEADLYQDFAKGSLDALLEIGPNTIQQVTDSTGSLDFMFESAFSLYDPSVSNEINFYYNTESGNTSLFSFITDQNDDFYDFESALGELTFHNKSPKSDSLEKRTAYIAYTENPSEVFLADAIAEKISSTGVTIVMNSSYAVTEDVTFSTIYFPSATKAITWKMPVLILSKPTISGILISKHPWNISFDGVTINESN